MVKKDGKYWLKKGVALGEQGKYEESLECFNKAIEILFYATVV